MALSPPVAGHPRRHERRTVPQALADALENPRDDLDRLIGDLRLATRFETPAFDQVDERVDMICAAIRAATRGQRPKSAAPLAQQQAGGKCSAWF